MNTKMRVLVACEFSGVVRDEFTKRGHDAISVDLLPSDSPGKHVVGNVLNFISEPFDLVIAHPPCTYLANSGVSWLHKNPNRWELLDEGAEFFRLMSTFNSPRICIENPIQHKYAVERHGLGRQSQVIHPYQFGHMEQKATCLWLFGLPKLKPTSNLKHQTMALPNNERQRLHYLSGTNPNTWKLRSTTFKGIATAMAEQWGTLKTV